MNHELIDRLQTAETLVERLAYAVERVMLERTTASLTGATETLCRCALEEVKNEYPWMKL